MIYIIIFLVFLLIFSWVIFLHATKPDGKLIVDEVNDSWTVSITTDTEKIKSMRSITLTVDIVKARL